MCGFFKRGLPLPTELRQKLEMQRKNRKKSCMLPARDLTISWGDTPHKWNWISMPDSRFHEVAKLCEVWWLEIRGNMKILALSPDTQYGAYLVFKMIDAIGFHDCPVVLSSVRLRGSRDSIKTVCLDPNVESMQHNTVVEGLQRPSVRSNGWLEIEMGVFFNSGLEDREVQMNVKELNTKNKKTGLFVGGIEVRPK